MDVLKNAIGIKHTWGGEEHSGWLPAGATTPGPTREVEDVLVVQIVHDGGGFLLIWTGTKTGKAGDSWFETAEQAEQAGLEYFGIPASAWTDS